MRPSIRRRGFLRLPAILPSSRGRRGVLRLPAVLALAAGWATSLGAQATRAPAGRAALELEVADVGPGRVLCMHHDGAPLAAGATIWLVQPDTPQSLARAVPGTGACAPWPDRAEKALAPLRVVGGALDRMRLSIAIVGWAGAPVLRGGIATADLDGDGVPERFRACTSSEGVHLTIWSGAPLTGRLRWHRYFYLGYDVEPDCTEADYRDPPAGAALERRPPPG